MNFVISKLEKHLEEVPDRIISIPEDELLRKAAPGKWLKKEILGHLVDSAIYNIIRFTQAQYRPSPFVVQGYDQDNLVAVNNYQNVPTEHILKLWEQLNRQIIFIWTRMPKEQLEIQIIRNGEPETLRWLVEDYVNHMEHHIVQIFR